MLQVLAKELAPDDRIGNYRVERELGPTGAGVLLLAQHLVLPRRVIIKVVHEAFAAMPPFVLQTLREACILEAIAHPGVPIVYESGLLRDRRPWFAFEVIAGPTLEELLAPGALPIVEVAGLLRDLSDILEHAHRRGVIHRGLRPDRVVITSERRYPLCIPDWSDAIAHDATTHLPQASSAGSSHYVAPEFAEDGEVIDGRGGSIDDRVDMFSLGVIAYRALTGALPFAGGPGTPYLPAQARRSDAPHELAALIDTLLAFDRFDRPSASDVRTAVDWLFNTLPELQHRAAPDVVHRTPAREPAQGSGPASAPGRAPDEPVVTSAPPRLRRPRWTPNVRYLETTQVDLVIHEDDLPKQ
jgi:eukaryotic-like serine/threonine-protein kinase